MHQHTDLTIRDIQANALSINCTGNWLALGGRRELLLLRLEDFVSERYKVPLGSKGDTSLLQWHPTIPNYLAAAQNDQCLVYEWMGTPSPTSSDRDRNTSLFSMSPSGSNSQHHLLQPIAHLKRHIRAVTSLHWSNHDAKRLATTSADSFHAICVWDLRDDCSERPAMRFESVSGASNFRWNRMSSHMFATSHESDVRIWDLRRGTAPVHFIPAHLSRVYDLDWNSNDENELVTCGHDARLKMWNMNNPRSCIFENSLSVLCVKSRFTPFGSAVLTLPTLCRSEEDPLSMFLYHVNNNRFNLVNKINDMVDSVVDFAWRRSPASMDYELFAWSRDHKLHCWRLNEDTLRQCGQSTTAQGAPTLILEPPESNANGTLRKENGRGSLNNLKINLKSGGVGSQSAMESSATTGVLLDDAECTLLFTQSAVSATTSAVNVLHPNGSARKLSAEVASSLNERLTRNNGSEEPLDKNAGHLSSSFNALNVADSSVEEDKLDMSVEGSEVGRGFSNGSMEMQSSNGVFLQEELHALNNNSSLRTADGYGGLVIVDWFDTNSLRCGIRIQSRIYYQSPFLCHLVAIVSFHFSMRYPHQEPKYRISSINVIMNTSGIGSQQAEGTNAQVVPCSGHLALKVQEDCLALIRENTSSAVDRKEGCLERCSKALLTYLNSTSDQTCESLVHATMAGLKPFPRSISLNMPRSSTSSSRSSIYSGATPHGSVSERSYTTNKDMNVPYHRYSGAYFAPNGDLVCFKLAKSVLGSLEHEGHTPRALSGASTIGRLHFQHRNTSSQSSSILLPPSSLSSKAIPKRVTMSSHGVKSISQRSSGILSGSSSTTGSQHHFHRLKNSSESMVTPELGKIQENVPYIQAAFKKDGSGSGFISFNESVSVFKSTSHMSMTSSRGSQSSDFDSVTASLAPLLPPSVVIYSCNVSLLLPVSQLLARQYKFDFDDVTGMAEYNATVVSNYGSDSKDLICFWRFIQEIAAQKERILAYVANATQSTSTSSRPLFCLQTISKKLMHSWFTYFRDLLDVQHLSFLCIVYYQALNSVSMFTEEERLDGPTPRRKSKSLPGNGENANKDGATTEETSSTKPKKKQKRQKNKPTGDGHQTTTAANTSKRPNSGKNSFNQGTTRPRTHNSSVSEAFPSTRNYNFLFEPSSVSSRGDGHFSSMDMLNLRASSNSSLVVISNVTSLQESTTSERRRSSSYNDAADDDDADADGNELVDSLEQDVSSNHVPDKTPKSSSELQLSSMLDYVRCYTHLLYVWGLLNKRAHLINHWQQQLFLHQGKFNDVTSNGSNGEVTKDIGNNVLPTEVPLGLVHGLGMWEFESIQQVDHTTVSDGEAQPTCYACPRRIDLTVQSTAINGTSTGGNEGNSRNLSGAVLPQPICARCKDRLHLRCSLCRGPVRGLSSVCTLCHHGGHLEHYLQWFSKQTQCPTGCGCRCDCMRFCGLPETNSISGIAHGVLLTPQSSFSELGRNSVNETSLNSLTLRSTSSS